MPGPKYPIAEARARCYDKRQVIAALYADYFRNLKHVGGSYDHNVLEEKEDGANMVSQNHLQEARRIRMDQAAYNLLSMDRTAEQERDAAISRAEAIDQEIEWVRKKLYDAQSKTEQSHAGMCHYNNAEILQKIEQQYKELQRQEHDLAELFPG